MKYLLSQRKSIITLVNPRICSHWGFPKFLLSAVLFMSGFSPTSFAQNIHIEIVIEAEGDSFPLDKVNDPHAYERLPMVKIDGFFANATKKAEIYCHQALGAGAAIQKVRNETKIQAQTLKRVLISHHSVIKCKRELNLDNHDRMIGKYLDHADFVLNHFYNKEAPQDDHQLAANTLTILKQIGAYALPTLWKFHVRQNTLDGNNRFFWAMESIIKGSDLFTLAELLSLFPDYGALSNKKEGTFTKLIEHKAHLLRLGRWPWQKFWPIVSDAIDAAVKHYLSDDYFFDLKPSPQIATIVSLLFGLECWLQDRLIDKGIDAATEKQIKNKIFTKLLAFEYQAPSIRAIKEYNIASSYFN